MYTSLSSSLSQLRTSTAGHRSPPKFSTRIGPALPSFSGFPRPSLDRRSTSWWTNAASPGMRSPFEDLSVPTAVSPRNVPCPLPLEVCNSLGYVSDLSFTDLMRSIKPILRRYWPSIWCIDRIYLKVYKTIFLYECYILMLLTDIRTYFINANFSFLE
jgi:hypothetical protein